MDGIGSGVHKDIQMMLRRLAFLLLIGVLLFVLPSLSLADLVDDATYRSTDRSLRLQFGNARITYRQNSVDHVFSFSDAVVLNIRRGEWYGYSADGDQVRARWGYFRKHDRHHGFVEVQFKPDGSELWQGAYSAFVRSTSVFVVSIRDHLNLLGPDISVHRDNSDPINYTDPNHPGLTHWAWKVLEMNDDPTTRLLSGSISLPNGRSTNASIFPLPADTNGLVFHLQGHLGGYAFEDVKLDADLSRHSLQVDGEEAFIFFHRPVVDADDTVDFRLRFASDSRSHIWSFDKRTGDFSTATPRARGLTVQLLDERPTLPTPRIVSGRVRKLATVDLDIDSDNSNGLDPLTEQDGRTAMEEAVEAKINRAGKMIRINNADADADGIPDFADGYNLSFDNIDQAGADKSAAFTPIVLELDGPIDLSRARIRFQYSSSDPAGVRRIAITGGDSHSYVMDAGHLRIWRKNGTSTRLKASVANGGNFVPTNVSLTPLQLGLTPNDRTVTLYVEAVRPSVSIGDQAIIVQVDPTGADGDGFTLSDTIRTTLLKQAAKWLCINAGDADADGIPDFADGYNLSFDNIDQAGADKSAAFVAITLELPPNIDLDRARLRIRYSSSVPAGVRRAGTGTPEEPYVYRAAGLGHLRFWTQDGSQSRDKASVQAGGHFIPAALFLTPTHLNLTAANRRVTLYLEAVRPSDRVADQTVMLELDADGAGPGDFVILSMFRATVVGLELTVDKSTMTILEKQRRVLTAKLSPKDLPVRSHTFQIRREGKEEWFELASASAAKFRDRPKVAGFFKLRVRSVLPELTCLSPEQRMEVQFPIYTNIVKAKEVKEATKTAWDATKGDAGRHQRRERGFWILLNTQTGKYEVTDTILGPWVRNHEVAKIPVGPRPADSIADPTPLDEPTYSIGFFHTHTPTRFRNEGRPIGPSDPDNNINTIRDVAGVVYDYVAKENVLVDGKPAIPAKYPKNKPAQLYHSGPEKRSTPKVKEAEE